MCALLDDLVTVVCILWRGGIRIPFDIAWNQLLYLSVRDERRRNPRTHVTGDEAGEGPDFSKDSHPVDGCDDGIDLRGGHIFSRWLVWLFLSHDLPSPP